MTKEKQFYSFLEVTTPLPPTVPLPLILFKYEHNKRMIFTAVYTVKITYFAVQNFYNTVEIPIPKLKV